MSDESKCKCNFCGEHVAFPNEAAGQMVECPHCKLETRLVIPPAMRVDDVTVAPPPDHFPKSEPPIDGKDDGEALGWSYGLAALIPIGGFFAGVYLVAKKRPGHGSACMAVNIIVGLVWLVVIFSGGLPSPDAKTLHLNQLRAEDAQQLPDTSLRPVQGAYGWNLGSVLPDDKEVKTNDDDFGITFDFDSGWLVLTEDRRIAAITVYSLPGDSDAVRMALKDKYGFREIFHFSSSQDFSCYFGPTNRQVVLESNDKSFTLDYRDEALCALAESQRATRIAATKKSVADDLKGKL